MPEEKIISPQAENSGNLLVDLYTGLVEQTIQKSSFDPDSFIAPYNPDDLWQKTGDYSIYEQMLQDDQVSICMQLKKDLVLGSGWHIQCESEDESTKEIKEFLENSLLNDANCILDSAIEEILTAWEFGFSITEKIFKIKEDGFLTLRYLKTRHPNTWLLHQDKYGNVERYEQRTIEGNKDISKETLIHYINKPKFSNPYGMSDLRPAYAAWFAKTQVIKYYSIFLEKAASPTPIARYEKNAPQKAVTEIFNAIKRFQTKTALAIPKEIEVDFLESNSSGEAYSKAINIFNMFIGRSLFIPDLLGVSGSETSGGSFALGKDQLKLFFMHINRRKKLLEGLINKHIIKPIVMYNFGEIEYIPEFKFKPIDDDSAKDLAITWLDAVKGKVFKPNEEEINHFRKLVKFPEGEVEIVEQQQQIIPQIQNQEAGQEQEKPEIELKKEETQELKDIKEEIETEDKKDYAIGVLPKGNYYKKVDFKLIKSKFTDYDNSILIETKPIIKKIYQDLYDQLQKKKIIDSKKIEKIDSINLKYLKELKQILKTNFLSMYKDAQVVAQNELEKSNFAQPVTSEEFLNLLEEENYSFVGEWAYNVKKKARTELIAAIKDGRPLSTVIDILDVDGYKLSETSLERYARTKFTEVMNRGRKEYFEKTDVVVAYQYSAILDESTSAICSGLNGKIFLKGTEPTPPMHFNCRSLLIPITKYEEFEVDTKVGTKPIQNFIEENSGAGFKFSLKDIKTNDPGVEFNCETFENIETITYYYEGKLFQKTIIEYVDEKKDNIINISHERFN